MAKHPPAVASRGGAGAMVSSVTTTCTDSLKTLSSLVLAVMVIRLEPSFRLTLKLQVVSSEAAEALIASDWPTR